METTDEELCWLLIDCLRKDNSGIDATRLSGLSPERWQAFLNLAAMQRVRPLLWHRLKQKGLAEAVPALTAEELGEVTRRNTLLNLRRYWELRRFLSALKPEGIPLVLLKGIFLAEAVYDQVGLREMNDIDVLVRSEDLTRVAEILVGMGYSFPLPAKDKTLPFCTAHCHLPGFVKKDHATIEVHWNLTPLGTNHSIDPTDLWRCVLPVQVAGCDALVLSPEDLLLHLCHHTSYHHQFAFGLRPSCDIAEMIAHFDSTIDWGILTERAVQRGWQGGVYLALRLAKELAGAEVPVDILERLRPAGLTETLIESARALIFTDPRFAGSISVSFSEVMGNSGFFDKIKILWKRVFLPRDIIAAQYFIPADSIRIYAYYPRRLVDLLRRYGPNLKKIQDKDARVKPLAERKRMVATWLDGCR